MFYEKWWSKKIRNKKNQKNMERPSYTLPNEKFVSYLRVSTAEQGRSGLGLDAQRETVERFTSHKGQRIIAEFKETESGKRDDRPELLKAIDMAKRHDATLIIAKLDRLSRSLKFICTLQDSGVKFVACDMPEANEFTVHIIGAMAQRERKLISERTKAALDAKRRREPDWKPGPPKCNYTDEGREKSKATLRRNAQESIHHRHAYHFIAPRLEAGMSYEQIARELNAEGYLTRYGNRFYGLAVRNIYNRFTKSVMI